MNTKGLLFGGVFSAAALLFTGCGTYVPDGSTVIAVKNSKREFDRADIRPDGNELQSRVPVNMRWYDTNTFITTATFTAGTYSFRARNYDGHGVVRKLTMESGKDYYEIDIGSNATEAAEDSQAQEGPQVTGQVSGLRSGNLSVLFVGSEIVLKTVKTDASGKFAVNAPKSGLWKIELHQLGQPARSWASEARPIKDAVDVGSVQLK